MLSYRRDQFPPVYHAFLVHIETSVTQSLNILKLSAQVQG